MALLDRIANYFKEWDGIDNTAPKMELSIHDLRYIADMNVERCRLIKQLNRANLKTEEIRNKAIDEFSELLKNHLNQFDFWKYGISDGVNCEMRNYDYMIDEIAEELKGGVHIES